MSSYWAGYAGAALVLTDREFRNMMNRYKTLHPDDAARFEDEYEELSEYDRVDLKWSLYPEDAAKKFHPVLVSEDSGCSGATLVPYYAGGRKNLSKFDDNGLLISEQKYVVYDKPVWAFFSERSLDGVHAFDAMPYHSYDAFVYEFKCKLVKYLPDGFDWNAHIGRFSYACYA